MEDTEITFQVPDYEDRTQPGESFQLSGWYSREDSISVTVISPNEPYGESTGPVLPGESIGPTNGLAGAVTIQVNDLGACNPVTHEYECGEYEISVKVDDSLGNRPTAGLWTVRFRATSTGGDGSSDVDMYINELQQYGALEGLPIVFKQGMDPGRVVLSPATADSVIAVGSYVTKTCWISSSDDTICVINVILGDVAPTSSRGPRRDGVVKPDISAPGLVIASTRSGDLPHVDSDPLDLYDYSHYIGQGTSFAAAHVTGAVALLLASDPSWENAYPSQVRARIMGTARRDQFTGPDTIWGAGKLDVEALLSPVMSVEVLAPAKGDTATTAISTPLRVRAGSTGADSVVFSLTRGSCFDDPNPIQLAKWPPGTGPILTRTVEVGYVFPDTILLPDSLYARTARIRATVYGLPRWVGGPRDTLSAYSDSFFVIARNTVVAVGSENATAPAQFSLSQNAPNPFNPVTTIQFEVAEPGPVTLRIYSVDGRRVRTLVGKPLTPGQYRLTWNGEDDWGRPVASGVYFCEAASGGRRLVRKMTVLK